TEARPKSGACSTPGCPVLPRFGISRPILHLSGLWGFAAPVAITPGRSPVWSRVAPENPRRRVVAAARADPRAPRRGPRKAAIRSLLPNPSSTVAKFMRTADSLVEEEGFEPLRATTFRRGSYSGR